MQNTLLKACLAGLLAWMPLAASAQNDDAAPAVVTTPDAEEQSCNMVNTMLDEGKSADEVVRAVVATGMSLAEATVFAMVCGGEDNRVAIATAGVAAAGNLAQAQFVADAVIATAGQTGQVADAVRTEVANYAKNMPQPTVHEDKYTPLGGGVSPAT